MTQATPPAERRRAGSDRRETARLAAVVFAVAIVPMLLPALTIWGLKPLDRQVASPGVVHRVEIAVDGREARVDRGWVSTVSFNLREVRRMEWLWLRRQPGHVLVDESLLSWRGPTRLAVREPGGFRSVRAGNASGQQLENALQMSIVAAHMTAGLPVRLEGEGISFSGSGLLRGFPVVSADGKPVETYFDYADAVDAAGPGGRMQLELGDGGNATIELPERDDAAWHEAGPAGAVIDTLAPSVVSKHAVDFPYLEANAQGSSGGLAYALGVYAAIEEPALFGGLDVVATGAINPDGSVVIVSGIEPKTQAAIDAGADVLYVPEPLEPVAQRVAAGARMDVVGVSTLREAIDDLHERSGGRT